MVEGAPLLRAYGGNSIEGSNPFLSATCLPNGFLCLGTGSDFPVVFEGYAGGAVNRPAPGRPEIALSGPEFSAPVDLSAGSAELASH